MIAAVPSGTLYVVATPLGNLGDLSPRAVKILGTVSLVACEDTRRTGPLLAGHGIKTSMTSFFEHNEQFKGEKVIGALQDGRDVALVSDAGTPGISDPGYRLVREARTLGLPVVPIPGPSAMVAALSVSGLPTDRFRFLGFLPSKATARRRALHELRGDSDTLIFYESPLRIVGFLEDALAALGDREAFLCREATKLHEEYRRGRLSELRELLASRDRVRGEVVLVVGGAEPPAAVTTESPADLVSSLRKTGLTRREAVKQAAARLGLPAREVYRQSLEGSPDEPED
jgi:16S rRNA (cytidine1402-2'-O)-methyltransferase